MRNIFKADLVENVEDILTEQGCSWRLETFVTKAPWGRALTASQGQPFHLSSWTACVLFSNSKMYQSF